MSWDPKTAVISYQPIGFYALVTKEVSKSVHDIKMKLELIEKELQLYKTEIQCSYLGRTITVVRSGVPDSPNAINKEITANKIQKLEGIQSSIQELAKDLNRITQGFESALELEIRPVNMTVVRLNGIVKSLLAKHKNILFSQQLFS